MASSGDKRVGWMGECFRHLGDFGKRKICDVWLPGSHDAGTYDLSFSYRDEDMPEAVVRLLRSRLPSCVRNSILAVVRRYARTQKHSIFDQLCYGSRYLDLRPVVVRDSKSTEGQTFISHGLLGKERFSDVLQQILRFLETNEKEFLVLDIYCLRSALRLQLPEDMVLVEAEIESVLGKFIVNPSRWDTPIEELLGLDQRVYLVLERNGANYHASYGRDSICRVWPNEFGLENLKQKLESEFSRQSSKPQLHRVLEFIRSVPEGDSFFFVKGALAGMACCPCLPYPRDLEQINRPLTRLGKSWLTEFTEIGTPFDPAIVMMDFVGEQNELLIEQTIAMNWPRCSRPASSNGNRV